MYTSKIIAIAAAALLLTGCQKAKTQGDRHYKVPTVEVLLKWNQGQNEWTVQLDGGAEKNPKDAKTIIPQGAEPTMFVVDIAGNATFKNPGGLSVWEGVNAKSSPQAGINSSQIVGPIVSKTGKTLVFFDLNQGTPVTLNYELHFNDGIPSVDPIIENNP